MASSIEIFWPNILNNITISFEFSSFGKKDIFQKCILLYNIYFLSLLFLQ